MLLKLKRTQRTAIGVLQAGVAYDFDPKKPGQKNVAESLLARGMAEKTTPEKVAEEKADAEARAEAAKQPALLSGGASELIEEQIAQLAEMSMKLAAATADAGKWKAEAEALAAKLEGVQDKQAVAKKDAPAAPKSTAK